LSRTDNGSWGGGFLKTITTIEGNGIKTSHENHLQEELSYLKTQQNYQIAETLTKAVGGIFQCASLNENLVTSCLLPLNMEDIVDPKSDKKERRES